MKIYSNKMNDTFDDNDSSIKDDSNDYGHFCIIDYDVYVNESYKQNKTIMSKKTNAKIRQKLREMRKKYMDKDFVINENNDKHYCKWLLRLWNYITH